MNHDILSVFAIAIGLTIALFVTSKINCVRHALLVPGSFVPLKNGNSRTPTPDPAEGGAG